MKLPVFSRAYVILLAVVLVNACSLEDATDPVASPVSATPSVLNDPATDTTAPTVPTGLNATATSVQVSLSWQASSDDTGVTGYEIFRDDISQGTVTTNQYSDNNTTAGQNYSYQVLAYDDAGNMSAKSAGLSVTTPTPPPPPADTTAPTVPNGLSATKTATQVTLSWQASTDNIGVTGYEVFRDGSSRGTVSTNQYNDTNVVSGQSYSYQVLASDLAGNKSAKSNALAVDVPLPADTTAPSVPTGLSATTTTTQVNLNWQASTDNIGVTGYEIFRDGISRGTVSTNQYNDTNVASSQSYSYQVLAFDLAGNLSTKSSALTAIVASVTPPADTTAPTVPTGLGASASSTQVSLNWSASSDDVAVTGYEIFRDGISRGTVSTNQYNDTSIASGQTYSYAVLAYDLAGNKSTQSTAYNVTVPQVAVSGAPVILYTDIVSGPTSGGEGNNGAYLSIFGVNFGNPSTLGTTTRLYINDQEVARYMLIKNAMSQTMPNLRTIQQITVQIGALGGATPGVDLPIKLVVNGVASNTDKTFMIQPGDIYYVDNVNGNDNTGVKNDPTKPFRLVQARAGGNGVLDSNAGPGDFVVMRGTGKDWTDLVGGSGQERFVRFMGITGSAPTGTPGNGPITIMGYPGENVIIQCQDDTRCGIHGVDGYYSSSYAASSDWITISSLRIRGGGPQVKDGPINLQHRSDNWRIVNNELFEWDGNAIEGQVINGKSYQEARAGGITGDGFNVKILGNHIHDINGGTKNHGIYVDGGAQNWEIAYNHMENMYGGNIIQTFDSGGYGNIKNIDIHHNRLHNGSRYGVNYSTATTSGKVYDNVIYNIAASGVRFSTSSGTAISVAHNTLYNTCAKTSISNYDTTSPTPASKIPSNASAIANDWGGQGITIQNNILHSNSNCSSYVGNTGNYNTMVIDNNLYTGLSASPSSRDGSAVTGSPAFTNVATADFSLGTGSAAIDTAAFFADYAIATDFLINPRVSGAGADIGAIELAQ